MTRLYLLNQKRPFVVQYTNEKGVIGYAFKSFYLSHSIDASKEDGTLGRLVNDDHIHPNCKVKRIMVEGRPHLCLFAAKEIFPGEEITYNYGDSSWPWRSMVS